MFDFYKLMQKFLCSTIISEEMIANAKYRHAGFGAERPLVANDNEDNMARNRRVELVKK